MTARACPVALHPDGGVLRIAAFRHPLAGLQIPKGRIEPGEDATRAAARELFEETGLETVAAVPMGSTQITDQEWHFALCRVKPPVRDQWRHLCADDGGHLFDCFWQP
ncbi:MAG: NUDIX domain-containing protein, partial [Pseudomonadota bacterium]